jgi:hypothetical protein
MALIKYCRLLSMQQIQSSDLGGRQGSSSKAPRMLSTYNYAISTKSRLNDCLEVIIKFQQNS